MVWKGLVGREKAFDAGQFGARALLHNLRDPDYGKTLSDLRAAFYSAPRLPLLYGGDGDLQQAIYSAVSEGSLEIVDGAATPVAVTTPNQVNLSSTGLRLGRPTPPDPVPTTPGGQQAEPQPVTPQPVQTPGGSTPLQPASNRERQLAFSFNASLLAGSDQAADRYAALFRKLYLALDERQISYLQGTLQLLLDGDSAHQVRDLLNELGINSTIKDL